MDTEEENLGWIVIHQLVIRKFVVIKEYVKVPVTETVNIAYQLSGRALCQEFDSLIRYKKYRAVEKWYLTGFIAQRTLVRIQPAQRINTGYYFSWREYWTCNPETAVRIRYGPL